MTIRKAITILDGSAKCYRVSEINEAQQIGADGLKALVEMGIVAETEESPMNAPERFEKMLEE